MRRLIAQILTVVCTSAASTAGAADLSSLDEHLWNARPLIIFASSENDPRLLQQLQWLELEAEEIEDRDVVIIVDIEADETSELRIKYRPRDFQIVLLGKDGEVKLRKPFPWDVRELSRAIDKMPMRIRELQAERSSLSSSQ